MYWTGLAVREEDELDSDEESDVDEEKEDELLRRKKGKPPYLKEWFTVCIGVTR